MGNYGLNGQGYVVFILFGFFFRIIQHTQKKPLMGN